MWSVTDLAGRLCRDLLEGKASEWRCHRPQYETGSEFHWRQTRPTTNSCETVVECVHTAVNLHTIMYYYYYCYYTRFKHVKSFTKAKNLKCERSQCHRRNARLYRAVLSLDLKVAMLTVISEVTVSESLFQTAGAAWQKAFLEKLRAAGLHWRMFAPRGLSLSSAKYCGFCLVSAWKHHVKRKY